jgi:hypothetical protein
MTFSVFLPGDGGILASEYAAFCQMEDKNMEFETLNGIVNLRQQLTDLQAELKAARVQVVSVTDDRDALNGRSAQAASE